MDLFGFSIRPAAASDYARLCKLIEEIDAFHRQALPDRFVKPDGPPRPLEEIEAQIAGPASAILVAQDSAFPHLIGFATVAIRDVQATRITTSRRIAEVANLGVARHARRHGVGRALMREAEAWGAARGAGAIELGVFEFNAGAVGFYEALGFRTVGRRMSARLAEVG